MATITEDYVSFETAKLLKEKGFDEGCSFVVNAISKGVMPVSWPTTNSDIEDEKASLIALPTLQMAMKWLREVHNVHIVIHPYTDKEGHNWSFIFDKYAYGCWQELGIYITDSWNTYEQACNVAIKYGLENII